MIEVMVVLLIVLGSSLFIVRPPNVLNKKANDFESTLIHLQYMALLTHTTFEYSGDITTNYPIRYNANGNINMGQTVLYNSKKITLLIGTGKIHEKRIHDD